MKRLVLLFVAMCVSSASAADIFLAVDGNDSNPGTLQKPFASIPRALEETRRLRLEKPDEPVTIFFRRGTYYLAEPIHLTPEESGTEAAPTTLTAYDAERVIISGGRPVTGFKEVAPGRWETTIPEVAAGEWYFSQLYVNSRRARRPFLPRNGYYTVAKPLPPTSGNKSEAPDRFVFAGKEFDNTWKNLDDVEICTFHKWTMDHLRIKTVDPEKKIVTFTGPTHSRDQATLDRSTYYRIENVYEAISQPGDWYLDRQSGLLTVLAKQGFDLNTATVIAPYLSRILSIDGDYREKKQVTHLVFRNLTFAHTGWTTPPQGDGFPQADVHLDGAVTMTAAQGVVFDRCVVRHTGNYGIDVSDASTDIQILGCELIDLGAGGIKIGPSRLGGDDAPKYVSRVLVNDCLIAHGGRVHAEGVGVWIGHADHCTVEHCLIDDFYYSAVSVGWKWGWGESPAHHNRIAWNHIRNIGQGVLNDMAGIYTLGESPGTVLEGNLIHDVRRANYGGWGIYFDQASRFIVAENNIVFRTQDAAFHQHWGKECIVRNNIFAFSQNGLVAISNLEESGPLAFERNIFLMSRENLWEKDRLREDTTFNKDLYWRLDGREMTFFGGKGPDQWRREKEADAVITDPGFIDVRDDDFSFRPDAAAIREIGFQAIDMAKPGRLSMQMLTASIPPAEPAFSPGIPEDTILCNREFNESFELYKPGDLYLDMNVESFQESLCVVTDAVAADGSQRSLLFREGTDSAHAWQPHMSTPLVFEPGQIEMSFDLYLEEGARPVWEMRDWRRELLSGGYKTGPQIAVGKEGKLTAGGKEVTTIPIGKWVKIAVNLESGPDRDRHYRLTVTMPDAEPITMKLPVQQGFEVLTWVGFMAFGEPGTTFYIDNIRLKRVGP